MDVKVRLKGAVTVFKKFERISIGMAKAAKFGMLRIGAELLADSVNMAPLDTGELVRSAKLKINNRVYARGSYYGGNSTGIELTEFGSGGTMGTRGAEQSITRLPRINMSIEYRRFDENGDDIAIRLHEDLLPRGTGPKHVRKPGRSGKFLEVPINKMSKTKITKTIADSIKNYINTVK